MMQRTFCLNFHNILGWRKISINIFYTMLGKSIKTLNVQHYNEQLAHLNDSMKTFSGQGSQTFCYMTLTYLLMLLNCSVIFFLM